LRDTADEIERLGIDRTWAAVERADLALLIVDARAAVDALETADRALLARLPPALPRVVVHNKADLAAMPARVEQRDDGGSARTHVWLSALTGAGIELLEGAMRAHAGLESATEDAFLARARHVAALRDAELHLARCCRCLVAIPPPLELFAEELRGAQLALAAITGEFSADDLLGVIFFAFLHRQMTPQAAASHVLRTGGALALGVAAGFLFAALQTPIPWMLGPLLTVASFAWPARRSRRRPAAGRSASGSSARRSDSISRRSSCTRSRASGGCWSRAPRSRSPSAT
jgi:hypothetical protein